MRRTLFLSLIFLLPAALWGQNQIFTGAVNADSYPDIRVQFRIIEDGKLLTGIDTSRLSCMENGKPVSLWISCPTRQTVPVSVAIGIERSLDNNFPIAIAAAKNFVGRLRFSDNNDEASLWAFATLINQAPSMTRDSLRLQREIDNLIVAVWPFNGTPLYETMHRAVEDVNANGSGTAKTIVFFTDGVNNTSYFNRTLDDVRIRANTDRIRIYVVGIGNKPDGINAMTTLCEATGGFYVHASHPRAADSIYEALSIQPLESYWCEGIYTSPMCPNGSFRNVVIQYRTDSGDTLRSTLSYKSQRRDEDLEPFPMWISPSRVSGSAGDTVYIALGIFPKEPLSFQSVKIELYLDGIRPLGDGAVFSPFNTWSVRTLPGGAGVSVELISPDTVEFQPGQYSIIRIPFELFRTGTFPIFADLSTDASGCLAYVESVAPRAVSIKADTVLTERRTRISVPFSALSINVPEGIQNLRFRVKVRSDWAEFVRDSLISIAEGLKGWTLRSAALFSVQEYEELEVFIGGPPIDSSRIIGDLKFRVLSDAPYAIPIILENVEVNSFHQIPNPISHSGLIVIRDSCRNNLILQKGMIVGPAFPNPFKTTAGFDVILMEPGWIEIEIYNTVGKLVSAVPGREISSGRSYVEIIGEKLPRGIYYMRISNGKETVIQSIVKEQ